MTTGSRHVLDLHGAEDDCGDSAVSRVRRALTDLGVGEHLEVLTDVADHAFLVRALSAQAGRSILSDASEGREHTLVVG